MDRGAGDTGDTGDAGDAGWEESNGGGGLGNCFFVADRSDTDLEGRITCWILSDIW